MTLGACDCSKRTWNYVVSRTTIYQGLRYIQGYDISKTTIGRGLRCIKHYDISRYRYRGLGSIQDYDISKIVNLDMSKVTSYRASIIFRKLMTLFDKTFQKIAYFDYKKPRNRSIQNVNEINQKKSFLLCLSFEFLNRKAFKCLSIERSPSLLRKSDWWRAEIKVKAHLIEPKMRE